MITTSYLLTWGIFLLFFKLKDSRLDCMKKCGDIKNYFLISFLPSTTTDQMKLKLT